MILNQAQAEAFYSAMCALNNVNASYLRASFATKGEPHRISVIVTDEGVTVLSFASQGNPAEQTEFGEQYASQAAFATAYSLN